MPRPMCMLLVALGLVCGLASCSRDHTIVWLHDSGADASDAGCEPPRDLSCVDSIGGLLDSSSDVTLDVPTAAATDDWVFPSLCTEAPQGPDATVAFRLCEDGIYHFGNPTDRPFGVGKFVVNGDSCDPSLIGACSTGYSPEMNGTTSTFTRIGGRRGEQIMVVFEGVSPADTGPIPLRVRWDSPL